MRKAYAWKVFLPAIVLASMPAPFAHAENYVFNTRRTEVRFSIVMGLATVRGRFNQVEGSLQYNEEEPQKSQVFAKIATASVETGQPLIDNELKGINFFNAKAQPSMTFRSSSVNAKTAGTAEVIGEITVNGVTKPVTLDVALTPHNDPAIKHSAGSMKFVAKTSVSRSALKMDSYADMVDDEIQIEIDAIVRPQK